MAIQRCGIHFDGKEVKGRGVRLPTTISRIVDRFLKLPPLSAARYFGVYKAGIAAHSWRSRYFAGRFDRVMNLASIPVRFPLTVTRPAFVPRREIACKRVTIEPVE